MTPRTEVRGALARLRKAVDTEAAERRRFFKRARPFTRYLSVDVKNLTFLVATDDRLGRGLFVRRWRQDFRHLNRAMRLLSEHELFRAESTFVDVGANIGTTTVRAIRRHGFARARRTPAIFVAVRRARRIGARLGELDDDTLGLSRMEEGFLPLRIRIVVADDRIAVSSGAVARLDQARHGERDVVDPGPSLGDEAM